MAHGEKGIIHFWWFFPVHIKGCTGNRFAPKSLDKIGLIDHAAPGSVNKVSCFLHLLEFLLAYHVSCGLSAGHMKGDKVRGSEDVLPCLCRDGKLAELLRLEKGIVADNLHIQA